MNILNKKYRLEDIKKLVTLAVFLLVAVLIMSALRTSVIFAQASDSTESTNSCDTGLGYSANINTQEHSYNIFIKLGMPLQKTTGRLTINSGGNCKQLLITGANGISWSKIGTINLGSSRESMLTLEAGTINGSADVNRPTILLVPSSNAPCQPKKQCSLKNEPGSYIEPAGTAFAREDLHVLEVVRPEKDTIDFVGYFVDDELMYKTSRVEPFNKRYLPVGSHTVTTKIYYKSGQQIIKQKQLDQGVANGFQNFVFTIFAKNKSFVGFVVVILTLLTLIASLISLIHHIYQKRLWLAHHDAAFTSTNKTIEKFSKAATYSQKLLPWLAVITLVFILADFVPSHVSRIIKVHGLSMSRTMDDKDMMIVSRFGKWWSSTNGQEYIPRRGEVIIYKRADSAFLTAKEKEAPSLIVKRVIAVPGERITIKNGKVRVYNSVHPKGFDPDKGSSWDKTMRRENLKENIDLTVGKSEVFVLGDNRTISIDSRYDGPISINDIYGHTLLHGKTLFSLKRV